MSLEISQLEYLENLRADFDTFLAQQDWKNAQAVVDNLCEHGYDHEADILRKALLQAQYESVEVDPTAPVYEPVEDEEAPFITPEEDDAPHSNTYEVDEKTERVLISEETKND